MGSCCATESSLIISKSTYFLSSGRRVKGKLVIAVHPSVHTAFLLLPLIYVAHQKVVARAVCLSGPIVGASRSVNYDRRRRP